MTDFNLLGDLPFNGAHPLPVTETYALPNFKHCVEQYSACNNLPIDANYDPAFYIEKEKDEGAMIAVTDYGQCVGFCFLVFDYLPHLSIRYAGVDSIFILPDYRKYWGDLKECIHEVARTKGCRGIIVSARVGSRFERLLKLKYEPVLTNFFIQVR